MSHRDPPEKLAKEFEMTVMTLPTAPCGCAPKAIEVNPGHAPEDEAKCNCGRKADKRLWHSGWCSSGSHANVTRGWQSGRTSAQDGCLDYAIFHGETVETALAWAAWVGPDCTSITFRDSLRAFKAATA